MVWPAVIGGVAGLVGGAMANRSSAKEASKDRAFQEAMSRTAHQREVEDLRAAGLNPILSGTGGRGASTPGGSRASQIDPISGGISSGLAARRQSQELKNMKEQQFLIHEQGREATYNAWSARESMQIRAIERDLMQLHQRVRDDAQAGNRDEAKFWSSKAYYIKRRADAGLETARKLIPFTSPGGRGGYSQGKPPPRR